ncbi:Rhodanese-like protein [Deinococcus gobiensis I-0]|uniref:Rhodanese-like protein n=2 Tax=Deinococcus TaxID=1298 RepID=H8GTK0_DEIGI|nr:Rhodanese-like protein [Deinococcus gobiensis I-0]
MWHAGSVARPALRRPRGRHNPTGPLGYAGHMKEANPTEGHQMVQDGALLVDVREQGEYDQIHAEGATLLPLSEFEARYAELPKDRPLVMICRSGARSARAGEYLLANGYGDVTNLAGGTQAWAEAGLPTQGEAQ